MIGLAMRAAGVGGGSGLAGCVAVIAACCIAVGLYKCSQLRLRDCPCCKWWLLSTGQDSHEDFELFVIVHECYLSVTNPNRPRVVRLTAGEQTVSTDPHARLFQQPMTILVEQGVSKLEVDLMNASGQTREARAEILIEDILQGNYSEHIFPMKSVQRGLANPRVRLTLRQNNDMDEEEGVLSQIKVTNDGTGSMVKDHLQKVQKNMSESEMADETSILASACSGYLDELGSWGTQKKRWVAVHSKPDSYKKLLGIWEEKRDYDNKKPPNENIEITRIKSVQEHPSHTTAFIINEVGRDKKLKQFTFFHIDRSRDVWVQTLVLLIEQERQKHLEHKAEKASAKSRGPAQSQ